MGERGKESGASIGVIKPNISAFSKPAPPAHLTQEQADTWRAVVECMPVDWFPRETHGILTQYCRHVVSGRRIADLIEHLLSGEHSIDDYDRLLRMQEHESRAFSSLATRMRITQQAQINFKKRTGPNIPPPWQSHIK